MISKSRIPKRLAVAGALAVSALVLAGCGGDDQGPAVSAGSAGTVSEADVGGRTVLVTADGHPLYISDEEQASRRVLCVSDGCLAFWQPLTIDSGTPTGDVTGKLGVVSRPGGGEQVTVDGNPLYMFTGDSSGRINGDGLSDTFDGQKLTWHVVASDAGGTGDQGSGFGY